jgi:MerR family transcriptional regulator/heat shock protein HspR
MPARGRKPRAAADERGGISRTVWTSELYLISSAAELLDMHPQTLRKYERLGLVQPLRTLGSMRVYRRDELERLRLIKTLVDEAGINLAGVQRLLSIAEVAQRLRPLLADDRKDRRAELFRKVLEEVDEILRILGFDAASRR